MAKNKGTASLGHMVNTYNSGEANLPHSKGKKAAAKKKQDGKFDRRTLPRRSDNRY